MWKGLLIFAVGLGVGAFATRGYYKVNCTLANFENSIEAAERTAAIEQIFRNRSVPITLEPVHSGPVTDPDLLQRLRRKGFDAATVAVFCTEMLNTRYAFIDGTYFFLNGSSQKPSFAITRDESGRERRFAVHDLQQPENYIEGDNYIAADLLKHAHSACPF